MRKAHIFVIVLGVLLFSNSMLADVELKVTRPKDDQTFKTDMNGDLDLNITVKNGGNEQAFDVMVEVKSNSMDFSVSNNNRSIASGESYNFNAHGSGLSRSVTSTRARITATGYDKDGEEVTSKTVTIIIYPPKLKAKIISPTGTMRIVYPTTGDLDFKIWVHNQGEADLYGVALELEPAKGNLSCSASGGQNIPRGDKKSYNAHCSGIDDRDALRMLAYDQDRLSKDMETVTFTFVTSGGEFVSPSLAIVSPYDGQNITISEDSKDILVVVSNDGTAQASDVCVTIEELNISGANCSNIEAGESKTFLLALREVPEYVTSSVIEAREQEGDLWDSVSVRIKPLTKPQNFTGFGTIWYGNETPVWLGGESGDENGSNETSNNTGAGNGGEGDNKDINPIDTHGGLDFNLIVILCVAAILGIYLVIGIAWGKKKKAGKGKFDEEMDTELEKMKINEPS
ncbi:MAG: hypothetical protein JXB14_07840 [Candidatus Altiarchaeota archaeon]|nr:hypothetical protein [Candidatus Altiarchaeota archaeon]